MPERPDLDNWVPRLAAELTGRRIVGVAVKVPIVLRLAVVGEPASLLADQPIEGVTRRGPFVWFALRDLDVIIHPMLAGKFSIVAAGSRGNADQAVTLELDDGRELRYRDDVSMGKVYVTPKGKHTAVAGWEKIGLDVLDPAVFTIDAFRKLAKTRRDQAKSFLLDHGAIDHLGNAYADETLWAAQIHPKARVRELSDAQIVGLRAAMIDVLEKSRDEIASRQPPLDEKIRDFLSVRGRKGQPCPRCGTTIRVCGIHGHDAYFCPQCQPDAKNRTFVDWRKLPGS